MQNKGAKYSWAAAFTVASMWFGTHVGAGFATGNQVIGYFSQYGFTAAIYPILAMGILAACMYVIMKFANLNGFTNYKDTFKALYPKPWMEVFFEIFYIVIILAAVAGCITGAANVIAKFVGEVNYGVAGHAATTWIFNLIVTAILIILSIFGIKVVRLASTVLTVAIIAVSLIVVITGFAASGVIEAMFAQYPNLEPAAYSTNGLEAIWRGIIIYAGFQCVSLPTMIAGSADMNVKGVKRSCILGWIMNGFILALSGAMLAKWYPLLKAMANAGVDFYGQFNLGGLPTAIPNLTILTFVNIKWLIAIYSLLLFCAFISTSVTLIYSMIDRFTPYMFPNKIKSSGVRGVLVGIVVIGLCLCIAPLGLSNITKLLYGYDGYYAILVIFIPTLIWGIPKIKKVSAERAIEHKDAEGGDAGEMHAELLKKATALGKELRAAGITVEDIMDAISRDE